MSFAASLVLIALAHSALAPSAVAETAHVDAGRIADAASEPDIWPAHGRGYFEQRYSPLDDVNRENVSELGLAWIHETGTTRGLEATPIVVDGTMYLTGPWGVVTALDAATGAQIWHFDPQVPGQYGRYACCDVVNRGVAVWKGKVYVGTTDGRLVALDAATGDVLWEVNTIPGPPYTITGAPRVVKDKVIIGNGGAEYGVRGYITAYDTETGDLEWRFYTVPGNPAEPFEHPEMKIAAETWKGGEWWTIGGGGTVWDSMAYDPDLDLLYVGTGNGSPWIREIRSPGGGDNLYLSSILAIDPDDGRLRWHYQTTPGDTWDYTATQHILLADLEIEGEMRKVLMQAPKNGFFYVLDRETGELLSAEEYVTVTWATGIDMATGRPVENPEVNFGDGTVKVVLPSPAGGHSWHPMAFSPETGLVYIPIQEIPFPYVADPDFEPVEGWFNLGLDLKTFTELSAFAVPEKNDGFLRAWNPVKQEPAWTVKLANVRNGGVLATGGGLVFQGGGDGSFAAFDAATGERLWNVQTGVGIIAPPVTYAIDGTQYVAVLAGYGGNLVSFAIDPESALARYQNQGRVLVFKLGGGKVPLPPVREARLPTPPPLEASQDVVMHGAEKYTAICGFCHGPGAISSGVLPDLRYMSPEVLDELEAIVLDGAMSSTGMPAFGDLLTEEDVRAIRAYIIRRMHDTKEGLAPPPVN